VEKRRKQREEMAERQEKLREEKRKEAVAVKEQN